MGTPIKNANPIHKESPLMITSLDKKQTGNRPSTREVAEGGVQSEPITASKTQIRPDTRQVAETLEEERGEKEQRDKNATLPVHPKTASTVIMQPKANQ